ncbi:MAG: response regulator [Gammaproteobacteria bacterium]|nr:response regulator [Gammaproteobacteria bacterium]
MLNSNFLGAFSSNFILPLFYSLVLFDSVDHKIISIWLFINLSAFILRLNVCNILKENINEYNQQITKTLQYYYLVIGFSGFVWGGFCFYIVQSASDKIVSLTIVILIGLTAGAISTLGTIFNIFLIFVISILLPLVVGLFMLDDFTFKSIAVMLFIYLYVISKGTYRHYKQIKSNLDINERLVKSQQEAEEANKAKSQFLANMSHEIRTPINAILGFTELSLKSDKKNSDYLKTVMKSSQHLLNIINEILDLSKVESGEIIIENETFDVKRICVENEKTARLLAKDKPIDIAFIIDPNLPDLLKGDALRVNQILMNLMSNAVKFTEKGKITTHIVVKEHQQEQIKLKIEIEDTGIGLSLEQQKKLFKNFSQADSTITKKYGGTGLGLAICKQMIEKMGGTIEVCSELHKGSCFTVNMNFALPNGDEIKTYQEQQYFNVIDKDNDYQNFTIGTILLVEDNEVNQMLAETIILEAGFKVYTAENGIKAIEYLRKETVELVLMDINMPEMDGYQATKIIREELKLTDLPIIAMTANALTGDRQKSFDAGMNDYISKPISSSALLNKITRWSQKKRALTSEKVNSSKQEYQETEIINDKSKSDYGFNLNPGIPVLDRTVLDEIINLGKSDLVNKLIDKFIDYTPGQIETLKSLAETNQWQAFQKAAHSLKSSSAYLGAKQLSDLCLQIETSESEQLKQNSIVILSNLERSFNSISEALQETFMKNS